MSPSASDPVGSMRRATLAVWVAACACGVPLGWWVIAPLPEAGAILGDAEIGRAFATPESADTALAPLDLAAFKATLWNPPIVERQPEIAVAAPPPPPPPPPVPAGPAPVLLAILRGGEGSLTAALYDPAADQIVFVREGDLVLGRSVSRVTEATVELRVGQNLTRLVLVQDGSER